MKKSISQPIQLLLFIQFATILLHLAFILKLIPYDIAWGGRLQSDQEMYVFEAISLAVIMLLLSTLLVKAGRIKLNVNPKIINGTLWVFLVIFVLNTIGNLFAITNFEKFFAIVTGLQAFLLWKILRSNKESV